MRQQPRQKINEWIDQNENADDYNEAVNLVPPLSHELRSDQLLQRATPCRSAKAQ